MDTADHNPAEKYPQFVERIRQNIETTQNLIERAAQSAGRQGREIRMVIVTKTHPPDVAAAVVEAGGRILGENYPDESLSKIHFLQHKLESEGFAGARGVEWHMIGHVQSRKSAIVAAHFDVLHSLDSLRLAQRLDRQTGELAARERLPVLLEFNVGGEESKHGWPAESQAAWQALLPDLEQLVQLPHLSVQGLMTMPPLFDDPEESRPFFVKLRHLQDFLQKRFPQARFADLSMGTSTDYAVAIQEGATLVRIGRAILGPRPPK